MDLRVEKTLKAIKEAYYETKRGKSVGQIRVTDICSKARINKSTFYKYYLDVFDLADKMEWEAIREIMASCTAADKLFVDTEAFVSDMTRVIVANLDRLAVLFDDRVDEEVRKFEKYLIELYVAKNHSKRDVLLIRFCVGGAARMLTEDKFTPENIRAAKNLFTEIVEKAHAGK